MRSSPWPWLTLIACVAATGNAGAQVASPADAGAVPAAPPSSEGEEAPERSWRLPPLRLSGSLAYDGRIARGGGGPETVAHLLSANIGTTTYIYQPWFALVSGSLGLTTSWTNSSVPTGSIFDDARVHERIRGQEQFVTGTARLNLFPRSRFPAEVRWDRQDSRTDSGLNSSIHFRRQAFGVTQSYRPPAGAWSATGRFDHHDQEGLGFRATQDALSADFTTRWKANELALGAAFSRARTDGFDDESRFTSLVARHAYAPSAALSVNSTANLTRTEELGLGSSDLQVLQATSVGYYHQENSPLTLNASARGLMLRDAVRDSDFHSLGGTLGATYQVDPNLRLTGSGGVFVNDSAAGSSGGLTGSLGASYQGDSIVWRDISYSWFAGGSLGSSLVRDTESASAIEHSLNLQLGHNVGRSWQLAPRTSVALNAGQTFSSSLVRGSDADLHDRRRESVHSVLHTVAATWQNSGDGRNAYARASYSDSMELGGGQARFQLLNFQLSGNFELGHGRSISGDLTYQRSLQRAGQFLSDIDAFGGRSRSSGASGEVRFVQNQLFGVPRLRFTSRLRLAQDVLKQPGQLLSFPDRETRLWENRLDWSIGRLQTQVVVRTSQIDGARANSLWLRIQRNFGN